MSVTVLVTTDIVAPVTGGLAVGLQRAVHHHRGEAGLDRGSCRSAGLVAVIEMHAGPEICGWISVTAIHHVPQHDVVGIGAGAARRPG